MSLSIIVEGFENLNYSDESPKYTTTEDIINRGPPSTKEEHERAKEFTKRYPYGYPNSLDFQGKALFIN